MLESQNSGSIQYKPPDPISIFISWCTDFAGK